MNRKSLLIAQVKAEVWAMKVVSKHEKKFQPLMEKANASIPNQPPQQTQETLSGGQPDDQPGIDQPVQQY